MNKKRLVVMVAVLVQMGFSEVPQETQRSNPPFDEATGLWVSTGTRGRRRGPEKKVRLGVAGGVALANISLDPSMETSGKIGPVGGLALEISAEPNFLIQIEASYSQLKVGVIPPLLGLEITSKTEALSMGLFGKIRFIEAPQKTKPFLLLGADAGHKLSATQTLNGQTTDVSKEVEDWNFDLVGGLGIQFEVGPTMDFGLEARYYFGLTDASKDSNLVSKGRTLIFAASLFF